MQTNLLHPQELFAKPIRYEVPDFQRRYVWKQDEQWEPLWDDVADLVAISANVNTDPGERERRFRRR